MKTAGDMCPAVPERAKPCACVTLAVVALAITWTFHLGSCAGNGPGDSPGPGPNPVAGFESAAMLQSLGEEVFLPTYRQFAQSAATLRDQSSAWSASSPQAPDWQDSRTAAQAAWKAAMSDWQKAELMLMGHAALSL